MHIPNPIPIQKVGASGTTKQKPPPKRARKPKATGKSDAMMAQMASEIQEEAAAEAAMNLLQMEGMEMQNLQSL